MANELIPIQDFQPAAVFVPGGLQSIIDRIHDDAKSVVADPSTAKGRATLVSVAARIRSSKVWLDDRGKEYVSTLKDLPRQVDAERKRMRDALDALAEEVRRPVTELEQAEKARIAEAERIEREKQAAIAAAQAAEMEELRRFKLQAERLAAQQAQEERIAREAEARAQREAEALLAAAAQREQAALQAQRDAELRAQAAIEAQQAQEQRQAEAVAEAARAEQRRMAAEAAALQAETARREQDRAHKSQCLSEAHADFCAAGVADDVARSVVLAIAKNLIRRIRVEY